MASALRRSDRRTFSAHRTSRSGEGGRSGRRSRWPDRRSRRPGRRTRRPARHSRHSSEAEPRRPERLRDGSRGLAFHHLSGSHRSEPRGEEAQVSREGRLREVGSGSPLRPDEQFTARCPAAQNAAGSAAGRLIDDFHVSLLPTEAGGRGTQFLLG